MKGVSDLQVGDVIKSPLFERDDKGVQRPEKKGIPRIVQRVKPRTGVTYFETVQKHQTNNREAWELPSGHQLVT